jgi:hypothetical protein
MSCSDLQSFVVYFQEVRNSASYHDEYSLIIFFKISLSSTMNQCGE